MTAIFDLLFTCFECIVNVMRTIEVFEGVDILTFSIGVLILAIVISGILNVVKTGPVNAHGYYNREKSKAEKRDS